MPQPRSTAEAAGMGDGPVPTGPVTFLFSDIEGSTRLLQEAGDDYAALLEDHRRLIRAVIAAHGGREVDTQGDSFFVVFPSAVDAVAAAADAQRSLTSHPWPEGRRVLVRMGLDTGEAVTAAAGYIGLAVHRAARISAAAHGGQVLVSETTAGSVGDGAVPGVALHDLGEHRLKDFPHPLRLFRLDVAGLRTDFPPPRTLVRGSRLPTPATSIVGREEDVASLVRLLADERTRLITLTGPGGIGKTRLALKAAGAAVGEFPGGAVFVPLASIVDPALVMGAVADAVGVRREAGASLVDGVRTTVGDQRTLLVLDNVEQVVDAAGDLADLLDRVPAVVALVTSRQLLRLRSERHHPVRPLTEPAAVRLFIERATAMRPGFRLGPDYEDVVAEICRRLDGLPLAVELAAARIRLLPPQTLLARLFERLDLISGGPVDLPERQRTLRATMDWSYGLLEPHEQALFARLAVFAGGWSLEAAETVCGRAEEPAVLDTLAALVDASLVVASDEGPREPRFSMLETVRVYARELLAGASDRVDVERRHTQWMCAMTATLLSARGGQEHRQGVERLDRDRPDLRAAVQRTLDAGDTATVALLVRNAFIYLVQRDAEAEAVVWLDQALSRAASAEPAVRGRLLTVRALAATVFGDFALARSMIGAGRRLLPDDPDHRFDHALAATTDAFLAVSEDPRTAGPVVAEAIARMSAVENRLGQAYMEVTAGNVALYRGEVTTAGTCYATAVGLAEQIGDDAIRGRALSLRGLTLLMAGDAEAARASVVDGARINRRGGQPSGMAYSLDGLAAMSLSAGLPEVAARALAAAHAVREGVGHPASAAFTPLLEDLLTRARSALGDEAYEAAAAEGRAWTVLDALDRTLDDVIRSAPAAPEPGSGVEVAVDGGRTARR
ncbi:adenylate/guanylate cyclase domain-containing protein [Geodermatophilus sp. SYSU D01176]